MAGLNDPGPALATRVGTYPGIKPPSGSVGKLFFEVTPK